MQAHSIRCYSYRLQFSPVTCQGLGSEGHEEAVACTGQIENSFSYYKAHSKENVGCGKEGNDQEGQGNSHQPAAISVQKHEN